MHFVVDLLEPLLYNTVINQWDSWSRQTARLKGTDCPTTKKVISLNVTII
jgi:hypothetical protein